MKKVHFFELFAGITALIVVAFIFSVRQVAEKPIADSATVMDMAQGGHEHQVWLTDFEKAKEAAAAQGKDLLIDFSGSDWCYWCKRLDQEVFAKPEFIQAAGRDFILVVVDFPSDKSKQTEAQRAINQKLAEEFGVEGFPTVYLATADGKPYAQTGYQEGGVKAYLTHLDALKKQK